MIKADYRSLLPTDLSPQAQIPEYSSLSRLGVESLPEGLPKLALPRGLLLEAEYRGLFSCERYLNLGTRGLGVLKSIIFTGIALTWLLTQPAGEYTEGLTTAMWVLGGILIDFADTGGSLQADWDLTGVSLNSPSLLIIPK